MVQAQPQAGAVGHTSQRAVVVQRQIQPAALLVQAVQGVAGDRVVQGGRAAVVVAVDVAVEVALVAVAQPDPSRDLPVRRQQLGVTQIEEVEPVGDDVRRGVDHRGRVHPGLWQGLRAGQTALRKGVAQIQLVAVCVSGELGEQRAVAAGAEGSEAVVVLVLRGHQGGPVAPVRAITHVFAGAAETAGRQPNLAAWLGAAVCSLQQHRPPQGVQAVDRIGNRHQLGRVDDAGGHEIPIDRVAEGFIDAHPVQKHGQSLRGAQQGRGGEPIEAQAGLQRIALLVGQGRARQLLGQHVGQACGRRRAQRLRVDLEGVFGWGAESLGAPCGDGDGLQLHHRGARGGDRSGGTHGRLGAAARQRPDNQGGNGADGQATHGVRTGA